MTASAPLEHLQGRDAKLAQFGWTPRQAEWIALVCLHSGCFIRSQMCAYLNIDRSNVGRFIHSLIHDRLAVEATPQQPAIPRLCRLTHRRLYRALGAENIRYRRAISPRVAFARVLALDYILEHATEYWLPTEYDKLRFFHDTLKIPKRRLPSRVYQGHSGGLRRYFVDKFPIAGSSDTVTILYIDPGYMNDRPLRRWAAEHRDFFASIHEAGRQLRLVFVSADASSVALARHALEAWTQSSPGPSDAGIPLLEEIEAIKTAVCNADGDRLEAWGGLHKAMARQAELKDDYAAIDEHAKSPLIDGYSLWHSTRLAAIDFQLLDQGEFTLAKPSDA